MRRVWDTEALVEQFTILPQEQVLFESKPESNRLGFAVLFKFFQLEARFPRTKREAPRPMVSYLARQLGLSLGPFRSYPFSGRTVERHRAEIRSYFEFHECSEADQESLKLWLSEQVLGSEYQAPKLTERLYQHLRDLKLEPPAPGRVRRLVQSVLNQAEALFCTRIWQQLSKSCCQKLDDLLQTKRAGEEESQQFVHSPFQRLKTDPGRLGLGSLLEEVEKLQCIQAVELPCELFLHVPPKVVSFYRRKASVEAPRELRRHPVAIRCTLIAAFCWQRQQEILDSLVELLMGIVHRLGMQAERKVEREFVREIKRVDGKPKLLFEMAQAALEHPDQTVKEAVYPVVSPAILKAVVAEFKASGSTYQQRVYSVMRASYVHHYRRMVPALLENLEFGTHQESHRPILKALELLKQYQDSSSRYCAEEELVVQGVLESDWRDLLVESNQGKDRVNRVNYELAVLQALRDRLRSKTIWVKSAKRYGDPDADLPQDFEQHRATYYAALNQPLNADSFVLHLKTELTAALETLNTELPQNRSVRIQERNNGWIALSPLDAQPESSNLAQIKQEVSQRWAMTNLLDMLKEADLRISFTEAFRHVGLRESLERSTLQRRLLWCLYGLGTNTGLKRVTAGISTDTESDLRYVKRHYINRESLRNAISQVVNAILQVRHPEIWGEGTTACASDSKKFGSWDQNLMTEWHTRYGGRGVMIYWHVERKSACIYSQLKTCSSSEVAAMIEGLLRHCTDFPAQKNYVDTHGQSELAFAFCHLLGFDLLPRIRRIGEQKLSLPTSEQRQDYPNLKPVLGRVIQWDLIQQNYDAMVKYATALRLGTAEAETILRRFTRSTLIHPVQRALVELGKVVKTLFLCRYLREEALRREIQEGLNVVEHWNSANGFIFYGKHSEMATNRMEEQELSMLCLHLLQLCLVYINTLMIQQVLAQPHWQKQLKSEDLRALTPLFWTHVNPYGTFRLDLTERLPLEVA